jgi:hypothetical protein
VQFALPLPRGFADVDRLSRDIEVADGQTVEIDFRLTAAPTVDVKGRTVDPQGRPVAGAEVYVERKEVRYSPGYVEAVSSADGSFSLPGVEKDSLLRVRKGKWSTAQALSPGEQMTITLHPDALGSIRVAVKQPDGSPIAGAMLRLTTDNGYIGEKPASADGVGVFRSLAPDMRYTIRVRGKGFGAAQIQTKLEPGQHVAAEPIVLPKADSFITGTLVNEQGEPVPEVTIRANAERSQPSAGRTDINGFFRIDNLVAGDTVSLDTTDSHARGSASASGTQAGATEIILTLKPRRQP